MGSVEGSLLAKNQLDSIQYRLVTDGQTHVDSKYRASIASRGKTRGVFDVDCVYGNYVMHWSAV